MFLISFPSVHTEKFNKKKCLIWLCNQVRQTVNVDQSSLLLSSDVSKVNEIKKSGGKNLKYSHRCRFSYKKVTKV